MGLVPQPLGQGARAHAELRCSRPGRSGQRWTAIVGTRLGEIVVALAHSTRAHSSEANC